MHPKNLANTTLTILAALSGCFEEPRTAPTLPTKPKVDCEEIKKRIQYLLEFIDGSRTILNIDRGEITMDKEDENTTKDTDPCELTAIKTKKPNIYTYRIVCPDHTTYNIVPDQFNYGLIITQEKTVTPQNPIPVSLKETNNKLTFQVHSPKYWELVEEYNKKCTK